MAGTILNIDSANVAVLIYQIFTMNNELFLLVCFSDSMCLELIFLLLMCQFCFVIWFSLSVFVLSTFQFIWTHCKLSSGFTVCITFPVDQFIYLFECLRGSALFGRPTLLWLRDNVVEYTSYLAPLKSLLFNLHFKGTSLPITPLSSCGIIVSYRHSIVS